MDTHLPFQMINYPALPEDTLRAGRDLYGIGNTYIRLGDHLDKFLVDLIHSDVNFRNPNNLTIEVMIQNYLLTIIQYFEEMSNQQMSEAIHRRVDLKYALHLPMSNLNLDPIILCEFRRDLMSDSSRIQVFQKFLDRLEKFGLFTTSQNQSLLGAQQLLETVCIINRL